MKKLIRSSMFVFGLLSSAKVLALDLVLEEMSGGKSITTEIRDSTTLQQQLERELAEELKFPGLCH